MKNLEKQNDLAIVLNILCNRIPNKTWRPEKVANEIVNAIKPKGGVVLAKSELDNIIAKLQELEKNYYKNVVLPQKLLEVGKEVLGLFDDRNLITENDLKKAIAEKFGIEV